ncbi:MAG: hypothetical protein IJ809_01570 [Clostridia bacterium]|nr:hypothetical protein [Clostridia bacterium]
MKCEREDTDLKVGDVILEVDGESISTSKMLEDIVKSSDGKNLILKVSRNDIEKNIEITPQIDALSNEYKLNIWVKDSSAGVGTITFYEKNEMMFAGLGHGVTETEENYIVPIETGAITFTDIYNIKKGYANQPGEVRGTVTNKIVGSIITNTDKGIYGKIVDMDFLKDKEEIEVVGKNKIAIGKASIYTSVNYGHKEMYDIEIEKVMLKSSGNKNMIIKVTDSKLISLTGGIVQGMSGSPIIQNGKLIGAVTHVLLNDPTTGYGVFIENMIDDMENIDI